MSAQNPLPLSVKFIAGSLFLLIGFIAIFAPWISSLPIDLVIGWLFLVCGIAYVLIAFYEKQMPFWLTLATGVASAITGWLLITGLLAGVLTVTVITALYLLLEGTLRVVLSVARLPDSPPSFFILSGILAIAIAIAIGLNWLSLSPLFFSIAIGVNMAVYGSLHLLSAGLILRKKMVAAQAEVEQVA